MPKTVALIPLRGGSKSIPLKNIKLIGKRPLCAWVLEAAVHTNQIDVIYVSTDSDKIKEVVSSLEMGVKIINRPYQYATDEASTESVMLHFMEQIDFDILVTIQATSPLLKNWQLDEALNKFKSESLDSMLSVVRTKRFFWTDDGKPINYDPFNRPRRQEFTGTFMESGAFYITKREILEQTSCRLGGCIGVYEMPEHTAIDIDEPLDWEIAASKLQQFHQM